MTLRAMASSPLVRPACRDSTRGGAGGRRRSCRGHRGGRRRLPRAGSRQDARRIRRSASFGRRASTTPRRSMDNAGINRALSATLKTSARGAERGVGAMAVPADQLVRQRVVERHQRKRQQQNSEGRDTAPRTRAVETAAPATGAAPAATATTAAKAGQRPRHSQQRPRVRCADTARAAPRPGPRPGKAAALRPAGRPRCRAPTASVPATARTGTRRCGNTAPTARCPRRSAHVAHGTRCEPRP